ncbi:MAG: hypothetical protein ISP45_18285 [Reyranella sp.]|nr:hypothetical protein [Reyranella sp.]
MVSLARPLPQLAGGDASFASSAQAGFVARPQASAERLSWVDMVLIAIFLVGLYTNFTIMLSQKVPFPSVPSGVAGFILLWRRRDLLSSRAFALFVGVLFLYLVSIFCAPNIAFLQRRTNGLIQLSYSITIGYALFLTVCNASRRQIANLFLALALAILVGCLLETYGGLRPVSDAVRNILYRKGVYENDLRDLLFYNRVRPKFFASEPASVTFCYTLFSFLWLVISPWRGKLLIYLGLVASGLFAMPGPTLLLMLLLLLPYLLFLDSRRSGHLDLGRFLVVLMGALILLGISGVLAQTLFAHRLEAVTSGNDPSFFYRVQGPAIAGLHMMAFYPFAGAGLTGEPFIEVEITNLYLRSSYYSGAWQVVTPATELLINYFWLHWIYLGVVWGLVIAAAITKWLRVLGVPSPAFSWLGWAILGQASGAYVGPTCWAVLFLLGAAAVLHQRGQPEGGPATAAAAAANPIFGPQTAARLHLLRQLAGAHARSRMRQSIALPER